MMPRRPTALLPRLLADSVLPCALAALALTGALTLRQLRDVDETARLRIAVQQQRLDPAPDAGALRTPAVPSDPRLAPLRQQARRMAWLCGAFGGGGTVLLVLLATWALRYRVLMPMQRLQRGLDGLLAGTDPAASAAEPHHEFARAQARIGAIAGLLAAHRLDRAAIQRASAADALDRMRQSQAAARGKSQFMALVGHHFRQPLQALQLLTAGMHPGIDSEQQALLMQMRASIGAMTRLLDALLEISRLDAGIVTAAPGPFSVAELFLCDRAWLSEDAKRHGIGLVWHDNRHRLHGDAGLAAALLRQLVSNAIAFAPPHGRVLVAARRRQQSIRVEVRDNGPGIAAIHQQRIFEDFVQLRGEGEHRDGYGLGLAIAARLARLLGTQIGLRSDPGRGSTFWFELPQRPPTVAHDASRRLALEDGSAA